jgi:hypothetical protein
MRGLLMVLPVLLATLLQPACSSFSSKSTTSKSLKENPEVMATMEASLLSLFGFKRRPRPGKVVIPEVMLELYRQQTGFDVDTSALPLPGRHTRTANTVRSFPHIGEYPAVWPKPVHILTSRFHLSVCPAHHSVRLLDPIRFISSPHVSTCRCVQHIIMSERWVQSSSHSHSMIP